MSAKIVTIAQQKGGAGKSTLAAHLAVAWALKKKRVGLIDIDPQGTCKTWFEIRAAGLGAERALVDFAAVTGWRTQKTVEQMAAECDYVVIDSPPHAETEARIAVRAADLVLIPSQPSPLDIWATEPTVALAAKEKSPARIVLNRIPPRANLTARMLTRLGEYPIRVLKSGLGNRVAFAEAMAEGLTALEIKPSSQAAKEVRALANEVARAH